MFLLLSLAVGFLFQHASGITFACSRQNSSCGCSHRSAITLKITGGELAASHSWGWLVSLRFRDIHFCGGTILNEQYIITAAHCILRQEWFLRNITVCAGIDRLSDVCSQSLSMANVTIHHAFSNQTARNDIALLRLSKPLNFSDPFVGPICLPNTTHPFDYPQAGTSVVAIGWGSTKIEGVATNELQQVRLKILDKSARLCALTVFDNRVQICAYAVQKDVCRGDSGGPLMAFTPSKQWELVGVISYGKGCGNPEYSGGYTRVAVYQEFLQQVMNERYTIPVLSRCACQCPRGTDQGFANATENSPEECVDACIAVPSSRCTISNTYACLGTNCAYSAHYVNSTFPIMMGLYTCSCQCPYDSEHSLAYTKQNSSKACIDACIASLFNSCTNRNTYACLGTSCAYSSDYVHSNSLAAMSSFRCACQCPYGSYQGFAFAKENSTDACVCACRTATHNRCVGHNTYACLGTSCAYSSAYNHSLAAEYSTYRCSCQCPYGIDQGVAHTDRNSSEACTDACAAVPNSQCNRANTYACLDTDCVYSSLYRHNCSCQCPFGSNQSVTYTFDNTTEACVNACVALPSNNCIHSNTYACLEDHCVYSSSYDNSTGANIMRFECSCQCPYGIDQGLAFTKTNSSEACVDACTAVTSNACYRSNTYACLGTTCAYSINYVNRTSPALTGRYTCACQCPYGIDQGVAYADRNSSEACVDACAAVPNSQCNRASTYACLDTHCVYSSLYRHNCSCQCPFGSNQSVTYTFDNTTEACVNACVALPSNNCIHSNTYACLEDRCAYSSSYDNSSTTLPARYRCSCHCPYGSYRGVARSKLNSSEACVNACIASPSGLCSTENTYACLGSNCAYSSLYNYLSTTVPPQYRCSCQCPYGHDQGIAYTTENTPDGCVNACKDVETYPCLASNTYACLGSECAYSDLYQNNSAALPAGYQCSCQCPYEVHQGTAYASENSAAACVSACQTVPWNSCDSFNTYACRENECAYSYSYVN